MIFSERRMTSQLDYCFWYLKKQGNDVISLHSPLGQRTLGVYGITKNLLDKHSNDFDA